MAEVLATAGIEAEQVAVAIEVPRGAIVDTPLELGLAVFFAINPKQLDRFRHSVAGAKDDRRDAMIPADSLRTDEPAFRRVREQKSAVERHAASRTRLVGRLFRSFHLATERLVLDSTRAWYIRAFAGHLNAVSEMYAAALGASRIVGLARAEAAVSTVSNVFGRHTVQKSTPRLRALQGCCRSQFE